MNKSIKKINELYKRMKKKHEEKNQISFSTKGISKVAPSHTHYGRLLVFINSVVVHFLYML